MPLLAGASPVAIAAVAAGVMLGNTETASQTASPLCARAPKCGASPSRMAACSTSGLIPSSTKSRTGLGPLFSTLVKAALVYPVAQPPVRTTTLPALRDEGPAEVGPQRRVTGRLPVRRWTERPAVRPPVR